MNLPETPIVTVGYDAEEGITTLGKTLVIYVEGVETVVVPKFYDPIRGFIQTETHFYLPKELI